MSGRKAGAMGLVERLAAALAVNEIVRSRHFLGENTSKEDREELLKLTASELTSTAQVLASAVHLRQQVETAEFTRALIEQQKAAQQPPGGPLACYGGGTVCRRRRNASHSARRPRGRR